MATSHTLQANMAMQRLLQQKGLYRGRIDGIIGPATHAALMAYRPASAAAVPLPRQRPQALIGSTSTGGADQGAVANLNTIPVLQQNRQDIPASLTPATAATPVPATMTAPVPADRGQLSADMPAAVGIPSSPPDTRWDDWLKSLGIGTGLASARVDRQRFNQASDPVTSDMGVPDELINAMRARQQGSWPTAAATAAPAAAAPAAVPSNRYFSDWPWLNAIRQGLGVPTDPTTDLQRVLSSATQPR